MPPPQISRNPERRAESGVALVIVLAFVVLLTGLVIAFFSATLSERQSSDASANQTRANLLARDALDLVLTDLKDEIVAGSETPATSYGDTKVYVPSDPATRVPARIGVATPGSNPPLANLVRRSARSGAAPQFVAPTTGYSGFPANRASAVSTGDKSRNGRRMTAARWNAPYLLPLTPAAATSGTTEPIADFADNLPDWMIVTRSGVAPRTNGDVSAMRDSDNANYALGRFAYTIYDEGGLLDVNAAGFPTGLTDEQIGRKGSMALADLVRVPTGAGDPLVQADVDSLVGWRNYATGQPGGSFPAFSFNVTSAGRWLENFVEDNETSYLRTADSVFNGRTDQAVLSRQQLLALWRSLDLAPEALQSLGTFSRDLAGPSFRPDPNRPRIVGSTDGEKSTLNGGNFAWGSDDKFNPSFLSVRVKAGKTFTRASDGTLAKENEPLVKYRFPLDRLGWITADGPAATISNGDPRYDEDGTVENVLESFGLTWNSADRVWVYDHGDPTRILRLGELADGSVVSAREPDFFELLQAAINVGSLGRSFTKAEYSPSDGPSRYDERNWHRQNPKGDLIASQPKYQICRIAAAIIDQADPDNYPTIVRINAFDFAGTERLPMLTRATFFGTRRPAAGGDTGGLGIFIVPEVWDPHDSSSGPRPSTVTVRCSLSPVSVSQGWKHNVKISGDSSKQYLTPGPPALMSKTSEFPVAIVGDSYTRVIAAGDNQFAEPAVLWRDGTPNLISPTSKGLPQVAGLVFQLYDPLPSYTDGFPVGKTSEDIGEFLPDSSDVTGFSVILEYQDAAGTWHVYNEMKDTLPVREQLYKNEFLKPSDTSISDNLSQQSYFAIRPDPRTSRFPLSRSNASSSISPFPWKRTFRNATSTAGNFMQRYSHSNSKKDASKPNRDPAIGWNPSLSASGDYEYYLGLLSVNQDKEIGGKKTFYADPDGVVRGADAMYYDVPSSKTDGDPITTATASTPNAARPVILNRPFRNVGELGYVFRDEPFKTLNFFSKNSGDAALLDVFTINEPATDAGDLVGGVVNLNTRNAAVLEALISRSVKDESPAGPATFVSDAEIADMAAKIVTATEAVPAINPADLVARIAGDLTPAPGDPVLPAAVPGTGTDAAFKRRRETAVRALSGVTNGRVWNLLIDLVAQTGRYPAGATTLQDFNVEGEKRYWMHVAIDRLTGEVIDRQLEPVFE